MVFLLLRIVSSPRLGPQCTRFVQRVLCQLPYVVHLLRVGEYSCEDQRRTATLSMATMKMPVLFKDFVLDNLPKVDLNAFWNYCCKFQKDRARNLTKTKDQRKLEPTILELVQKFSSAGLSKGKGKGKGTPAGSSHGYD